ncbi:MAG: glycosyltransferase [Thermoplasmata archaeon]
MSIAQPHALSVVLPVLDERQNVERLIERFDKLKDELGLEELIFVDDGSRDGTLEFLEQSSHLNHGYGIRTISREQKLGQVDACITGSRVAKGHFVAVMDADLQHPPEAIPSMLRGLQGGCDIAVGSRYVNGARVRRNPERGVISRGAMIVAHFLLPVSNRMLDPLSGFFVARKDLITDLKRLRGRCKLLLFVLSVHKDVRVTEVGFDFEERSNGRSKTVDVSLSFIVRYLIELITYMKVRSSVDSRFVSAPSRAIAPTESPVAG